MTAGYFNYQLEILVWTNSKRLNGSGYTREPVTNTNNSTNIGQRSKSSLYMLFRARGGCFWWKNGSENLLILPFQADSLLLQILTCSQISDSLLISITEDFKWTVSRDFRNFPLVQYCKIFASWHVTVAALLSLFQNTLWQRSEAVASL
jgi:hypothetical protein